MKAKTIMDEVEAILVNDERARNSDMVLYGLYLTNKNISTVSVVTFCINFSRYNVASFETISRCRRKLQETKPYLRATQIVQEMRDERQGSFFDFARGLDADV